MKDEESLSLERNRADRLLSMGRAAEAVSLFRKLVADHPDEDSLLLALAWSLHDSGETAEAALCFERLFRRELSRDLFTGFAYDELVRLYREEGNKEALVSVCERAAAAQPEDTGVLQTLADVYLMAARAADARPVFEKLIALEPDASEHWSALSAALTVTGDLRGAEAACFKAAELDPSESALFFSRLARGLLRAGDPDRAEAAMKRCLAAKPGDPLYLMELGEILVRNGRPVEAVEVYGRAAIGDPASAGACWHRLEELLAKAGFHGEALEAAAKAVAAEPENPRYLLRLAACYDLLGQRDLAVTTLRRAESAMNAQRARGEPETEAGNAPFAARR